MNNILTYSFLALFGIMPSLLWLQFYLRRDMKPEPKMMILKIFFYGMLSTIPAIFLETAFFEKIGDFNFSPSIVTALNIFLGVAFVEEFLKFSVIKLKVLKNPEFDEPVDAMIYMIIAALGFAAAENLLLLFLLPKTAFWEVVFEISLLRFLGATFLHALASGIIGFFVGLSFFRKQNRNKLILLGLTLAVILHGFYNLSIIKMGEESLELLIPFSLLLSAAVFISFGFKKLKKMAGIS
jgi:RsiW-degrading membrane proteinase PrsW (M82 family)